MNGSRHYQLDIPVDYANFMAVVQSNDQLLEEPPSLIFLKAVPLLDILKHVAARGKLHGNPKELIGQKHFFELDDVWMQQSVVIQQLPFYVFGDLHTDESTEGCNKSYSLSSQAACVCEAALLALRRLRGC